MLSDTLDQPLWLLGLDPEPADELPDPRLKPMPDWQEEEQVWRLAPADCACSGLCVCVQWVRTMSAAEYYAAQAAGTLAHATEDAPETRVPGLASVAAGWAVPGVWANPEVAAQLPSVEVGQLVQQLVDTTELLEAVIATELQPGRRSLRLRRCSHPGNGFGCSCWGASRMCRLAACASCAGSGPSRPGCVRLSQTPAPRM